MGQPFSAQADTQVDSTGRERRRPGLWHVSAFPLVAESIHTWLGFLASTRKGFCYLVEGLLENKNASIGILCSSN